MRSCGVRYSPDFPVIQDAGINLQGNGFFLVLPILREIWLEAELISIKISYSLGNDTYYFLQVIYSNNTPKRPMNYPETR